MNMSAKKQSSEATRYVRLASKVANINFLFILAYSLNIIIIDSWNLITPEAVSQRWIAVAALAAMNTFLWYAAREKSSSTFYYKMLLFAHVISTTIFAAFNVFVQRGIASRAVALFIVPIVIATAFRTKRALLATTAFCAAGYAIAVTQYAFNHPGEGYKVELYGELVFYSMLFFIIVGFFAVITRAQE